MALNMECDECGEVQSVGLIPNGRSGFADPNKECENPECNSVGHFSVPGTKAKMEQRLSEAASACRDVYGKLDEIMPQKAPS